MLLNEIVLGGSNGLFAKFNHFKSNVISILVNISLTAPYVVLILFVYNKKKKCMSIIDYCDI